MRSWRSGALAAVLGTLLLGATVPAQAEIGPGAASPETVTGLPLATWQTNGTVMDIEIVNNVAYVGGNFTKVRPPGAAIGASTEVVRNRLAAFDATTGALLSWAPSATAPYYTVPTGQTPDKNCTKIDTTRIECATVWSIAPSPDKKSIIVGGAFAAINGQVRAGLAAFTTATGALDPTFKPSVQGRVETVATSGTVVYAGGGIIKAGGQTRTGLAAFDFPAGTTRPFSPAVVRSTNTNITTGVNAVALSPDNSRLIVGGGFDSVAGRTQHGLTALDAQTGAPAPWSSNRIAIVASVTNLKVIGDRVYSTADAAGSESEGVIAFDAATGADLWYDSCRGASHSMAIVRGVVYAGSHSHDCGAMEGAYPEQYQNYGTDDRRRYTLRAEVPSGVGARYLPWSPRTNDGNGANAMATDDNTLWIGGEFTSVDNGNQQGLTRFSFLDKGAQNHKPLTPQAPVVTSTRPGIIDVSFKETEDPDNRTLVYQLIKDHDTANPVYQVTSSNAPWRQGWFHYTDDVADGSSHTYDVRATDPLGLNSNRSTGVTITAASSATALSDLAKKDQAALQLSFETRVSGKYVDGIGQTTASPGTAVTTVPGTGGSGNAIGLPGTANGVVAHNVQQYSPRALSFETLFKTTTTRGGTLMSFGNSSSPTSYSATDTGVLWMGNTGKLNFGLRPDKVRSNANPWEIPSASRSSVGTTASYNDGTWHHAVVTFDAVAGSRIFVDGSLAAEDATMTWSRSINSFLRIGGDPTAGFTDAASSIYLAGSMDEVAFYKYPLSPKQAGAHADVALARLSAPTGVKATATGPDKVDLTWRAVPGATSYTVARDGATVGTVATNAFSDTGLTATTKYAYTVTPTADTVTGPASDAVSVTTTGPLPISLVKSGRVWRYDASGSPASDWKARSYDDSSWASGPSELGHGEGDEATVIDPFMPNGTTRRLTTYFRTSFTVPDGQSPTSLSLRFKLDDGAVLYLNGSEVLRDNMPTGTVGPETKATTWAADDGQTWRTVTIPVSQLTSGTNVLAVEVHQNDRSSLDLTWDAELTAKFD